MRRWIWLIVLAVTGAAAEDRDPRDYDRPLDVAVQLSHTNGDLDINGTNIDTSVDRVGVAWRERYGSRVQLGLIGGWASLTQRNDPLTAGRELNGYYAGFSLDVDLWRQGRFDSFAGATWIYQRLDHSDGTQRVLIVTREPNFRLGAGAWLGGGVRAYGGVRYGGASGDEELSGVVNETRAIAAHYRTGGFAGLDLWLDADGYVGVVGERGDDRRVAIYFGRQF